ncbi:hypothetical protein MMC11_007201 [Xylographa trunciseda]|nr:hypothetical protein [Xylographa trunciseda]
MASASGTQAQQVQAKRSSVSSYTGVNTSLLLEKTKAGIRRSTPDSEAMASSDDEIEQRQQHASTLNQQALRSGRRQSWLSDTQQAPQRKASINGSYSSIGSHPSTPTADTTPWPSNIGPSTGSNTGRGHSNSTSFPWGNAIWTNDTQKGPPSRLKEVLPSPTTVLPPGSSSFFGEAPLASPPIRRNVAAESSIPFAIPLHPTPKTYRSQSYSVGQLDPELLSDPPVQVQHTHTARTRAGSSYAGVQHRPSRPSMLGDLHDNSVLEQLREVDDDEESSGSSEINGVQLSQTQARTIEQLAMENAILRQAAAASQMQNIAAANSTYGGLSNMPGRLVGRALQRRISESVLEESDEGPLGLEDLTNEQGYNHYGTIGRRFSEVNANAGSHFSSTGFAENRKLESIKKGQWQSSLGFGGLADIPQSRRHSFADVPTRHGSISSNGDAQNGRVADPRSPPGYSEGLVGQSLGDSGEYDHFRSTIILQEQALELEHLRFRNYAASYFSNADPAPRRVELYETATSPALLQQAYNIQQQQQARAQHSGHPHSRHGQLLYLVTFKAARAEFYYVQEGTGLQVNVGDLVIVEADRGTDLGTVAHENVDWATAKELKEHYIEEHYKWLMMFSRHGQNGSPPATNPNAVTATNGAHGSTIGGIGSPGQHSSESSAVEIKPKMIKRLAQTHEIQTLREKEGNEAKAKRMCQQKVLEHHLNMEILDAEFQMDWKKLTFYYFADSYINFNSLVTDLFKIYKTRIWMSAINPASFVTPTAGLQLPSGLGPGAVTSDRDAFANSRQKRETTGYAPVAASQAPPNAFDTIWNVSQEVPLSSTMVSNAYAPYYQPQTLQQLNLNLHEYGRGIPQAMRSPSPFSTQAYGVFTGMQQPPMYKSQNKHATSRSPYANAASRANQTWRLHAKLSPNSFGSDTLSTALTSQQHIEDFESNMARAAKRKQAEKGYSPSTSPKKSNARKRKRQATILSDADSDESEEDIARLQSQQFLLRTKRALKQKTAKQKDGYADKFKATVEEKKQALLAHLEKRAHDSLTQRTKGQEAITSVLAASLAHHVSPTLGGPADETKALLLSTESPHPLQQKAISLLSLSKELLRAYDKVSEEMAGYEERLQVGQHWEGDYQKLQHLLGVGKQVTEDRVRAMLVEGHQDSGNDGAGDGVVEQDRRKWEDLSGVGKEDDRGDSWAVVARKMEKGVRRLMGHYKYIEELHKKKQSDVLRFLLRVRCWELRQLNVIHRASRPSRPDKARRLGYKAKQGYVIYRVRVRRGGRKRPVPKGATYGKPTNQGVNQLKYQRSLKSTAEERVGRRCANLRVVNSYWINQDSTYKYFEVILVDPQHKAIRNDARINWIVKPVHKHRESRGLTATGKKSRGLGKGHKFNHTTAGRRKTWKRHNTQSYWRYR